MHKHLQLLLAIVILLPASCGALSGPPAPPAGRITAVSAASRNDVPLTAASDFYDGDLLVTRQLGHLRLTFTNGAALRVGPETEIKLQPGDARLKQTALFVRHGRVRGISTQSGSFAMTTPMAAIASSLGADFEIIATPNLTELRVYSGKVTLTNTADAHPLTLVGGLGIAATPAGFSEPFPVTDADGLPEHQSAGSKAGSIAAHTATSSATAAAVAAATGAAGGAGTAAAIASRDSATRATNSVSNTNPQ